MSTAKLVETAIQMRESTQTLVALERKGASSGREMAIVDNLDRIIKSQSEMIDYLIEHSIKLGELLDKSYEMLDESIKTIEGKT